MGVDPLKEAGRLGKEALEAVEDLGEETLEAVEDLGKGVVEGIRRLTHLHLPMRKGERPLKRSKTGYETELFLLDGNGDVTDAAAFIAEGKRRGIEVTTEAMRSVVEVLCMPHHRHQSVSAQLVENLTRLSEIAAKDGKALYPYATYPGSHPISIYKTPRYLTLRRQLGRENFENGMRCCGYHQHYTLPRGLFDHSHKRLRVTSRSKLNRTLLDSYNFLTAATPAITCLMQSSPYLGGRRMGKDARMIVREGDGALSGFRHSMYARHPALSTFGPYRHTVADLRAEMDGRYEEWELLVRRSGKEGDLLSPEKRLSYNWGPLKINPLGTLEYRAPDMTMMSTVIAVSTMVKFSLRKIQQDFALVTPLDIGVDDAFRLEGNMLFIPPYSTVRERLWRASAYEGFESRQLRRYVRRLYRFSRDEIRRFDPEYLPLLNAARKIIGDERTASDRIVHEARKAGCADAPTQEFSREHALRHADLFLKDLRRTRALLAKAEGKEE